MSLGKCRCDCSLWGHAVCDGTVGAALPKMPHLEGWAELPCCRPCYDAITAETDRRAIEPKATT